MTNCYLAQLYIRQDRLDEAKACINEEADSFAKTLDGLTDPLEIMQICIDVFRQLGSEERAAEYRIKAKGLKPNRSAQD